jgi:hypothetical protein
MPAPDRDMPKQRFTTSIDIPKGLWGYYTDAEVDALLAALPTGGGLQTVDLSAYATTAYVDGKIATVYTKAEVDAAIKASRDEGALDLDAVQTQVLFAATEIGRQLGERIDAKADQITTYTKDEVDAAIAAAATGDVDLSAYATVQYVDDAKTEIMDAATDAFRERYTKQEVDGLFVQKVDMVAPPTLDGYATEQYVDDSIARIPATDLSGIASDVANLQGIVGTYQSATDNSLALLNQGFATVAQKPDVDAALALKADKTTTTLITTQLQAVFDSIYTRPEADDRYAKRQENTQAILTKTITASAYGFGDTLVPPAALAYIDTGEGYGARLVLNVGVENDFVVMKSDLESLNALLPRIEAMENKTSAALDLSSYATKGDLAPYVTTTVLNTMMSTMATTNYVDAKITALNPTGAVSINDPALADFKKSVLDEVKRMMAGGTKMPPTDIDWTWMIRMDGSKESVSTEIQARMLGGFIELKGTLSFNAGSGAWVPLRLPPQFPVADIDASYPLAMRLVGSAVTYGYCSVSSKNRDISCSPGARSSEANFSGIRWKAAY